MWSFLLSGEISAQAELIKEDSFDQIRVLKKNQDFKVVYQNGTSYANRLLVMYVLKNQHMKNRLGISVSKKVGNSVVRHRLTRLIRESYRLNETDFDSNLDIVVVARAQPKRLSRDRECFYASGKKASYNRE